MTHKAPEGMIPVDEFARQKGITPDKAITMIRDGLYDGMVVGGEWFVKPEGSIPSGSRNTSSQEGKGNAHTLKVPHWIIIALVTPVVVVGSWMLGAYGTLSPCSAVDVVMERELGLAVPSDIAAPWAVPALRKGYTDHPLECLAALWRYERNRLQSGWGQTAWLQPTQVQVTRAGCTLSDISVKSLKAKFVDECSRSSCIRMKGVAVLTNRCAEPVGVQVKITAYDEAGLPVATNEFWPASVRNIPPGDYTFSLDHSLEYDPEVKTFTLTPILVKYWR